MSHTTLRRIMGGEHLSPDQWASLLLYLGKTGADEEPLSLPTVCEAVGLDAALSCLRACDGLEREARSFTAWCGRQVQHLMDDPSSLAALDVGERYAKGEATDEELLAAREAAQRVVQGTGPGWGPSEAGRAAARDAALAAVPAVLDPLRAAAVAARCAAGALAWWASEEVARESLSLSVPAAVRSAKRALAYSTARAAQEAEFRRVFGLPELEPEPEFASLQP